MIGWLIADPYVIAEMYWRPIIIVLGIIAAAIIIIIMMLFFAWLKVNNASLEHCPLAPSTFRAVGLTQTVADQLHSGSGPVRVGFFIGRL